MIEMAEVLELEYDSEADHASLELASRGVLNLSRIYMQFRNGEEGGFGTTLPSYTLDLPADQYLYTNADGETRAVTGFRQVDLFEAIQDSPSVYWNEAKYIITALFNNDFFRFDEYERVHVPPSKLMPRHFVRSEAHEELGIDPLHFYLKPRDEFQAVRKGRGGVNLWWAKYRTKYWQMDDVDEDHGY